MTSTGTYTANAVLQRIRHWVMQAVTFRAAGAIGPTRSGGGLIP